MKFNLLMIFLFMISCEYNDLFTGCTDPEAANYDPYANIDDGNCFFIVDDCISQPSFVACIKPIIDNNCVSCHSYGGSANFLILSDYNSIKSAVQNNNLLYSIENNMPPNGLMSEQNISIIKNWIENEMPNN